MEVGEENRRQEEQKKTRKDDTSPDKSSKKINLKKYLSHPEYSPLEKCNRSYYRNEESHRVLSTQLITEMWAAQESVWRGVLFLREYTQVWGMASFPILL